ncbi:hypothetical protein FBU30_007465 [Linnemannia zychae]|nr:hypothetical protein FBU30_007465 [Linnemannia zychae]
MSISQLLPVNDLTTTPTGNPLLTVGAYEVDGNNGKGYNTVFDYLGSGTTYTVTGSTTASTAQNIIALTNPQSVSMGGISLTSNAIPVTMGSTSYILDQRSDGSTAVYYIKQSSSSSNLSPLSIKGQVIKFNSILSATTLGSYIITYSNSASSLTPTFNSLDTTTGVWSGPGLITSTLPPLTGSNPSSPPSGSSGNGSLTPNNGADNGDSKSLPLGGIIGGVVGGLIVIAAAIYLLVRRRRKNENSKLTIDQKPTDNLHQNHNQVSQIFPQQLQKSIQSPQAYHLHQPQEGYEQNQEHQIFNPNFTSSQQVYQPIQHPQQPQLYSGQSEHVYIPPTLIPPQYENNPISSQQPAPVIIESPVQSVGSSPANSHIIYSTTGLPRAPECRDANWNSATTIVPITSTSNKQLSSTVLDQIQALYQNPPANPQQTP